MTDRELLEYAAKAAGYMPNQSWQWVSDSDGFMYRAEGIQRYWNPRTDDGDALRLAVKLNIGIISAQYTGRACAWLYCKNREFFEEHGSDIEAATRRAIVRAAAEIGKAMP